MAWGTLNVGALVLKETDILQDVTNANSGVRTVRLEGRETNAGTTGAEMLAKHGDFMSLIDRVFPLQFERKTSYNGYYRVTDTNTELEQWVQGPGQSRWSMALEFLGTDNAVDLESRLADLARLNDFVLPGVRWHAPPIGHTSYFTGFTAPAGAVVRTGSYGAHSVYLGVPASVTPRWGCPVASYTAGRVRLMVGSLERIATSVALPVTGFTVDNGLVRWSPQAANGQILLEVHDGTGWAGKGWHIAKGGATTSIGTFDQATILRNEPECVVVRLTRFGAPGRTLCDVTLRRGSRFIEVYLQTNSSTTLGAYLDVPEATTDQSATGYVVATADDANGDKFAAGSARAITANLTGGLSDADTVEMGFWLGVVVGGAAAVVGDSAVDLRNQYIGTMPETIGVTKK